VNLDEVFRPLRRSSYLTTANHQNILTLYLPCQNQGATSLNLGKACSHGRESGARSIPMEQNEMMLSPQWTKPIGVLSIKAKPDSHVTLRVL